MAQDVAKELGIIFERHLVNSGVSYLEFNTHGYVGWVYEPDMDYIYDLVFAKNCCAEWSQERRSNNLSREFEKSGIFLVGQIKVSVK